MTLPKTSFAMVQTAARKLEPMDIPMPQISDDDGLIRIDACGICGSDYEQYEGVLRTPMPAIPGHEPLGTVAAIGDGAAKRWGIDVGDRIAVETMLSCHHCGPCLGGSYHLCDTRRIYSYIPLSDKPGLWGSYAQYMYLDPNAVVHKVDKTLAPETAVMFNPLGAGFRWGVEIPKTGPGDTIVIMGPGQRGLASVLACREAGAEKIIVTGLEADAKKMEIARAFGADATIDVQNENARQRVQELTNGRGADVVLDVSSYATEPVVQAIDFARMGGCIVLAGVKGFKAIPNFVSDKVVMKELTIKGAIGVTRTGYASAIRLLEKRKYDVEMMHTHDFKLEDAELAIKTLARQIEGEESIHSCLIPEF
jgi:threonine dehydrogenase-like Zn-dependent dehydrogenase